MDLRPFRRPFGVQISLFLSDAQTLVLLPGWGRETAQGSQAPMSLEGLPWLQASHHS